jgi:hypothetical protein
LLYYTSAVPEGAALGLFQGEMSEWFMELVLKTSDAARRRGFESLSLRQAGYYPGDQARESNLYGEVPKFGRRGSPAKGVGRKARREGSNPSFSAKEKRTQPGAFFSGSGE